MPVIFSSTPQELTLTTSGAWTQLDISSYSVPATAVGVILRVYQDNNATWYNNEFGLRMPGSTDNRVKDIAPDTQAQFFCGVSGQKIEYYVSTNVSYYHVLLIGYFDTDEAVFFTNGYNREPTATDSWQTVDVSSLINPSHTAVSAIFEVIQQDALSPTFLRKKGSTDDHSSVIGGITHRHDIVGVDLSGQCEAYIDTTGGSLYCIGYVRQGAGISFTDQTDVSLSYIGSYEPIYLTSLVPEGETAYACILEVVGADGTAKWASRPIGKSYDIYKEVNYYSGTFIVPMDAVDKNLEAKISNANVDFYVKGLLYGVPTGNIGVNLPALEINSGAPFITSSIRSLEINSGATFANISLAGLVMDATHEQTGNFIDNAAFETLTSNIQGKTGEVGDVTSTLPKITMQAAFVGINNLDASIAHLRVDATGDAGIFYDIDTSLRHMTASGTIINGSVGQISADFEKIESDISAGNDIDASLSYLETSASGLRGNIANVDVSFKKLLFDALCLRDYQSSISGDLHNMTMESNAVTGMAGSLDVRFRKLRAIAYGLRGNYGTVSITLPIIETVTAGYGEYKGTADLILPKLTAEILLISGYADQFSVYVINTKTRALTMYDNYNFNSLCKFNGRYLAAGPSGIYLLEGDDDDGTGIDAVFRTGKSDYGASQIKRIVEVYIGLRDGGGFTLTTITDDGVANSYAVSDSVSSPHTVKVDLARGVKGRYHAVEISNSSGASFEIDNVELIADVLSRKV